MFSSKDLLTNKKQLQMQKQKLKPIAIDDKEIDLVLQDYQDLRDPDFTAWHAKKIKNNGISWYIDQCKTAIQEGRNKKRYLTWLLTRGI